MSHEIKILDQKVAVFSRSYWTQYDRLLAW